MTQAKKPHVHAELMKAYAEDCELNLEYQDDVSGEWYGTRLPCWNKNVKYRIKPEPIKTERYRRWISKTNFFGIIRHCVQILGESGPPKEAIENHSIFVRWIDEDWQEGVVVDA